MGFWGEVLEGDLEDNDGDFVTKVYEGHFFFTWGGGGGGGGRT